RPFRLLLARLRIPRIAPHFKRAGGLSVRCMPAFAGSANLPAAASLVQYSPAVRIVDVGLVVPEEAGVDVLRQRLALDRLDGRLDRLVADADRVLRDGAGHEPFLDGVDLGLAGVVPDHDDLAGHVHFPDGVDDADGGTFVGAEY